MNHTPGPWKAIYNGDFYDICCSKQPRSDEIGRYSPSIGSVHNNIYQEHTNSHEEANANLMAAAPDMYEALKKLVGLLEADDPVTVGCHCTATNTGYGDLLCPWCMAQKAVAKAEGK